jgi:uncharacterized protein
LTMAPELEALIKLQRLETTIAEARARVAAHPQLTANADARLAEAKAVVDAAKERLKVSQEERRALEKDAALYQGRLTKFKDQLAAVKTNREYQAMQAEIEAATRELGVAEEKVIEHMVGADAIASEIKAAETVLAARQKEVDAEKKTLIADLASAEVELSRAVEARAALLTGLEPRLISLFEQVSRQRKGVGICMATRDGLCSLCHVRLRPSVFQQIRQNSGIIQCESCQRILYWIPPPPPIEPPVVHA